MKGFGLAVQQASPRAGKQSSVPAHYHTKPHATLQEQRGPQQKKKIQSCERLSAILHPCFRLDNRLFPLTVTRLTIFIILQETANIINSRREFVRIVVVFSLLMTVINCG